MKFTSLRIAVCMHLLLFFVVITGIVPREIVPWWAAVICLWAVIVPPQTSVLFFTALIPTFVAIPITTDFDNFNTWRIVAVIIFLRWFFSTQSWQSIRSAASSWIHSPRAYPMTTTLICLCILALASATQALDTKLAFLRIIYFANAVLVPVVAFTLARTIPSWRLRLIQALCWSALLVTAVALIQLASTYVMDVYAFMRLWGEGIQLRQFGTQWSSIAVTMGNTWLAYYGPQLSLRVFSLFTDSHSFPIYLLLAMSGIVAIAFRPIAQQAATGRATLKKLLHTRAKLMVIWAVLALLAIILSGTRGIWAASIGLPLVGGIGIWWFRSHTTAARRLWWKYLLVFTASYYLLFAIAWPIFISPQFLLSKGDWALLGNRVRSIVDFGETSNAQRLEIWRATLISIGDHPFLGVGIGNFPTVLHQHVTLARAGSSAHNVWLHVAAEMGVPALMFWIGVWLLILQSAVRVFARDPDWTIATWAGWLLIVIPWIGAYLLTDAAIFDERALLMFGIIGAAIRASDSYAS
jgi:O-antigen ligase